MRIISVLLISLFLGSLQAQVNRSEIEKATRKGVEMISKGNFEDAIKVFNDVIKKDPNMGKAILYRARTKYELGAYKGTKKDCFNYMDRFGIDAEVAGLLGKAEKATENFKPALAYLKVALMFEPEGIEYLMDRAEIFYNLGLDDQACADWNKAAENGSEAAQRKLDRYCKSYLRKKAKEEATAQENANASNDNSSDNAGETTKTTTTEVEDIPVVNNNSGKVEQPNDASNSAGSTDTASDTSNDQTNTNTNTNNTDNSSTTTEEEEEEQYPVDNSVQKIVIDEDLTIIMANGIGNRAFRDKPDIMMLSDKSGEVTVNICVDRLGRVTSATLNEDQSTITVKSLVSLALRESSNLRFVSSSRKKHCGTITFVISSSEE